MLDVEIVPIQDSLVLRARGSELLIMSHHVVELKGMKAPKEFGQYFLDKALINRPARKLFLAWLRKDNELWRKVFKAVQEISLEESKAEKPKTEKPKAEKVAKTEKAAAPAAKPKAEKVEKAEKTEKKETKKVEAKSEKKTEKKDDKKAAKKKDTDKDDKKKKKK